MVTLDRTKIYGERYSNDWIVEYLSRRGLTPQKFCNIASEMTQKDIAKKYSMQKVDVGKILQALDFDTQKSKSEKLSAVSYEKSKENRLLQDSKKESLYSLPEYDEIVSHVESFGWNSAFDSFPKGVVENIFQNKRLLGIKGANIPTARLNRADKELDSVKDDLLEVLSRGEPLRKTFASFNFRDVSYRKFHAYARWLFPEYKPEVSEETRKKLSDAAKRKRVARAVKVRETLDSISDADLLSPITDDLMGLAGLSLYFKLTQAEVLQYFQSRFNIDLDSMFKDDRYLKIKVYSARHGEDLKLNQESLQYLSKLGIEVPFWASNYPNVYKVLTFLSDEDEVNSFIESEKITSGFALYSRFPIGSYSNFAAAYNNAFDRNLLYTATELESLVQGSLLEGKDESEISSEILKVSDSYSNMHSLGESFGLTVTKCRALIKHLDLSVDYKISAPEAVIANLLDELAVSYTRNSRRVLQNGKEVDFYVESSNLAIEVNPTHTHNSTVGYKKKLSPRPASYHLSKSKAAFRAGVTLVHLYDWDMETCDDLEKTKAFLKFMILGPDRVFYARKTSIKKMTNRKDKQLARDFLAEHHRQGAGDAQFYYSLWAENELLAVASFTVKRNSLAELKRLAFAEGTQVRFGLSKLVKAFSRDHPEVKTLHSYSNNDYGIGSAYKATGFEFVRFTKPSVKWVNPTNPHDSYSWAAATQWSAKSGILARSLGGRDVSRSEAEALMASEMPHRADSGKGYVQVYTAGSILWSKTL